MISSQPLLFKNGRHPRLARLSFRCFHDDMPKVNPDRASRHFLIQSVLFSAGSARFLATALAGALVACMGCSTVSRSVMQVPRHGDEIVVCGERFRTGTRVVLWSDPGGYDAYRVERRFSDLTRSGWEESHADVPALGTPNRYGSRAEKMAAPAREQLRGGGWQLSELQKVVDQFVIHFDATGTSRECFRVLHDNRGLSVHFMLDLDGTVYQTLDLKERAWHATTSNTRSVGIEIANPGCFDWKATNRVAEWYRTGTDGRTRILVPSRLGDGGIRTPGFVGRPDRDQPVSGRIQGEDLMQYDFTPEQYQALTRLAVALCRVFPNLRCDAPRDSSGGILMRKMEDQDLQNYTGILGHFHIQTNKVDPGPAFQWERFLKKVRAELGN